MTPKQRLLAALDRQPTDCVPSAPFYLSLCLRPHVHRLRAEGYARLFGEADERPVAFEEHASVEAEAWGRAYEVFNEPPDYFPLVTGSTRAGAKGVVVRREGDELFLQWPGGHRQALTAPFSDAVEPLWDRGETLTVADVERRLPLADADDLLASGQFETTLRQLEALGDSRLGMLGLSAPYCAAYNMLGFAGAMTALTEDVEVLRAIWDRRLQNALATAAAAGSIGVECIFVEEWMCSSDLISPAQYEELAWPYERRLLEGIRERGLKSIFYFCGGVEDRLALIRELPADAFGFEEPKKNYDLRLERLRGEMGPAAVLVGNLDVTVLRDAPRGDIEKAVREQYDTAGPRFIAGIGSPVTLDTPPERVDWLTAAAHGIQVTGDGALPAGLAVAHRGEGSRVR